jgi:glycine cleavage system regulatory protein
MNVDKDLLHAQILAIDDPAIEELLRKVYDRMRMHTDTSTRMTVSWTGNSLWVRLDCIDKEGALVEIVRVPLNEVPALKNELHRKGELEALMVDIRDRFRAQAEFASELVEREMYRK